VSYSSAIGIVELDSNRNPTRTLSLRGGGLPKMGGANWGGANVLPTTWYPGNSAEATQQVLVAKEIPSQWSGEWRLTVLNRAPCSYDDGTGEIDVASPGTLWDILEDLFRKGQRLRVTWVIASSTDGVISRTVLREGRAEHWDFRPARSVDVEWQCSFSWVSRGAVQLRAVTAREADVESASSALVTSMAATVAAINAAIVSQDANILGSASRFTLGQLENLANAPLALVQELTRNLTRITSGLAQVGAIALDVATLPFSIANTVISFAKDATDQALQFSDQVGQIPLEAASVSSNVADLMRSFTYFSGVDDEAQSTALAGQVAQQQLRDQLSRNPGRGEVGSNSLQASSQGTMLGIRVVKQGDTPQSLSQLYYATVDHDIDILRANHLPWYQVTLVPGTLLVIPVVNATKGP
jgi:hypothetical protein